MDATRDVDNRCRFCEGGFAAAFAFSALDGEERLTFEAHLRGCPICAEEVAALTALLSDLPLAVDEIVEAFPTPLLRDRVLTAIHGDSPDLLEGAALPPERRLDASPTMLPRPAGDDDAYTLVETQITTVSPVQPTARPRRR